MYEPHPCTNLLGQYTYLCSYVFDKELGAGWDTNYAEQIKRKKIDFSSRDFALETLRGPEGGITMKEFRKEFIEIFNLSKNQLTEIDCLSERHPETLRSKFASLRILNVSKNMLVEARIDLDKLMEVNLSHNVLTVLPNFEGCVHLAKLLISHNRIDSDIGMLHKNTRLNHLDISHNLLSWKPSDFKKQIDQLRPIHIEVMNLWPNPFAEHFKEYQFLTVVHLDTIRKMDNWDIDNGIRIKITEEAELMSRRGPEDWTAFDIAVEERKRRDNPFKEGNVDVVNASNVPNMKELNDQLSKPLENSDELIKHIYDFETAVGNVWGARFQDRRLLLQHKPHETDNGQARAYSEDEERENIDDFIDRLEQLLGRHESVRDVLIKCVVRMMASGTVVGNRCAQLLADWVDANASTLQESMAEFGPALLEDICFRALPGLQSVCESPKDMFEETHKSKKGQAPPEVKNIEAIAESASILEALSHFGAIQMHVAQGQSPIRAACLDVFLPAICRESRTVIGEDKSRDKWQTYVGFDAFPNDGEKGVVMPRVNLPEAKDRCVKQGFRGFVVDDPDEGRGEEITVYYKRQNAAAIIGMRRVNPIRTLYVRPTQVAAPVGKLTLKIDRSWDVWFNALAVLVTATEDPLLAARAVSEFRMHEVVVKHAHQEHEKGFSETWLRVTKDAENAFAYLLRLAANLCRAFGDAGQEAVAYFIENKIHTNCWERIRRRLKSGGAAINLAVLKTYETNYIALLSALLSLVCRLSLAKSVPLNTKDQLMRDLCEGGLDVFDILTFVIVDSDTPEPLLLASALESLYMFIESDVSRPTIIAPPHSLFEKLHEGAILLPYLRGPKRGDTNNMKFQDLWRECELRYGAKSGRKERLLEAIEKDNGGTAWRRTVPSMKQLQHPLMFRILLILVKLFKLFINKQGSDFTGELQKVNDKMDSEWERDEMLIGPTYGIVSCSDYDIKIECMKCILEVVEINPAQFDLQEMGWLLRHLQTVGLGVGKQQKFLISVLNLVGVLIRNHEDTGTKFRKEFGKWAIRSAFEMLMVNCERDCSYSRHAEQQQLQLTIKITEVLQDCSRPLSGGLRAYLRNLTFIQNVLSILALEDTESGDNLRDQRRILQSWTARDMQMVLLPVLTNSEYNFRAYGVSKWRAVVRTADVLEGRVDYNLQNFFQGRAATEEKHWWCAYEQVRREIRSHDEWESNEHEASQQEFVSAFGFTSLMDYALSYFEGDEYKDFYSEAKRIVEGIEERCEEYIQKMWNDHESYSGLLGAALEGGTRLVSALADTAQNAVDADAKFVQNLAEKVSLDDSANEDAEFEAHLQTVFNSRLRSINEMVMDLYRSNMNVFDHKENKSTLPTAAQVFAKYFKENQKAFIDSTADDPVYSEFEDDKVADYEDKIYVNGRLHSLKEVKLNPGAYERDRPRQILDFLQKDGIPPEVKLKADLKVLSQVAKDAQRALKHALISIPVGSTNTDQAAKDTLAWANLDSDGSDRMRDRIIGSTYLVDFLSKAGATVYDPKQKSEEAIERKLEYKYYGDLSRIRDAARIQIEVKGYQNLKDVVQGLQKHTKLGTVIRIKNRYRRPTGLGRRYLILNVAMPIPSGYQHALKRHVCEIRLLAHPKCEESRQKFIRDLEVVLRDSCEVPQNVCRSAADFMVYQAESRAVRDNDVCYFPSVDTGNYLENFAGKICCNDPTKNDQQGFCVEREAGMGSLKFGDVVRLRSISTGCYIDAGSTGKVQCRFSDLESGESNFYFIVETIPATTSMEQIAAIFGQQGKGQGKRHKQSRKVDPIVLHTSDKLRFRVWTPGGGSNMFLTVMPAGSGIFSDGGSQRVLVKKGVDSLIEQQFSIIRRGSTKEALEYHKRNGMSSGKGKGVIGMIFAPITGFIPGMASEDDSEASPAKQMLTEDIMHTRLRYCFMKPTWPGADWYPQEGGPLGKVQSQFRAVALKQAFAKDAVVLTNAAGFSRNTRAPLMMASVLHCFYALLTQPTDPYVLAYAYTQLLGNCENQSKKKECPMFRNILACVYAAQISGPGDRPAQTGCLDLTAAWLPAKLLRLMSIFLLEAPVGTERLEIPGQDDRKQEIYEDKLEERGEYDKQNLRFLFLAGGYIEKCLARGLIERLQNAMYRTLNRHEMVLLRETARAINSIALKFLGNPFRWSTRELNAHKVHRTQTDALAIAGNIFDNGDTNGNHTRKKQSEIFSKIVPGPVLRLLVHAMLYAMHREWLAYQSHVHDPEGAGDSRLVKTIASLVNHSIHAVGIVTHCLHSSESTDVEYNICETLSQAMTNTQQVMPRSRTRHFMVERSLEMLREKIYKAVSLEDGEQLITIGFARIVELHTGEHLSDPAQSLQRRLIITTSNMRLLTFEVTPDNSILPDDLDVKLDTNRDLKDLYRIIVSPRMRQLIGLIWVGEEEQTHKKIDMLIFESSMRQRHFREFLHIVPERKGLDRGRPELLVRTEVFYRLRDACQVTESGAKSPLVSVTFTLHTETRKPEIEVLILSREKFALVTLSSFLQLIAFHAEKHWHEPEKPDQWRVVEDSDSDDDTLPEESYDFENHQPGSKPDIVESRQGMKGGQMLKAIKMVFFKSEDDGASRMQLNTDKETLIHFFSDCDKQRWRHQLSTVLTHMQQIREAGAVNEKGKDQEEESVALPFGSHATGHADKNAVKKELKDKEKKRLKAEAQAKVYVQHRY